MKNILLTVLALIFSAGISFAQDSLHLGFEDAVKMAIDKNIQLQQERNNLESAQATSLQNKALYLPSIGAYSDFQYQTGIQFNQLTGKLFTTTSRGGDLGAQARYTIFDGLGRLNKVRNTQFLERAQENNVEYTKQTVIYNLARQYLQVLLDRELVRIDKENLNAQQISLNQIEGYVKTGTQPLGDQLTQEAQVKKLEVTQLQAENKLSMDNAVLSQILMLDPGENLNIEEPDWGFDKILAQEYNLNDLYQEALNNRPDFKKAMENVSAAQASVAVAKSAYYPSVSATYNYGTGYTSTYIVDNEVLPLTEQLKRNRSSYFGLSLNIPIFTQLNTASNIARQKVVRDNYQLTEKNMKSSIYQDVQTAYLNLMAARNEYHATQSQYDAAVEAQKIQQQSYDLGVSDLVQLSLANQTYIEAASSRAQARYTLLFQKVMLEYATGTLNPDNMQ